VFIGFRRYRVGSLRGFLADLRSVMGLGALRRVGRKILENDLPGLAGQLAYFVLLSLFPFLMFLVALVGLMINEPESALKILTERMQVFLPGDAAGLLVDYIDRTLQRRSAAVLFFGILATLGSASAASGALIKAANRAYEVQETRSSRRLWVITVLMVLGLMLLVAALALVVFSPETGGTVQRLTGLPDIFLEIWNIARWVVAFSAMTLALDILYYVAPDAGLPFKWITPGGFAATVLTLISSSALNLYVTNIARYDQLYGQVGAVIVLMLWLYVVGFMALVGIEINAVLARMAEEKKGVELIQTEDEAEI
jgi:membrane protein